MSTDASATPIKKAETPDPIDSVPPTESLVRAALDDIALLWRRGRLAPVGR